MKQLLTVFLLVTCLGGCSLLFPATSGVTSDANLEIRAIHIFFGVHQSVDIEWSFYTGGAAFCGTVTLAYSAFKDLSDSQLTVLLKDQIIKGAKTECEKEVK